MGIFPDNAPAVKDIFVELIQDFMDEAFPFSPYTLRGFLT